MEGTIFNIQRFSIHDGPGIRTTVFVKGCPLRCVWCHNPESNQPRRELLYYRSLCSRCGACVSVCPYGLISLEADGIQTDRERCRACGRCVAACPQQAREISGELWEAAAVVEEVKKDRKFYWHSGGGVTVSGGEPLSQADFVAEILFLCRREGIHTAVETCGHAFREQAEKVFAQADVLLYDWKHEEEERHRELTGVSHRWIWENLQMALTEMKKEVWLRMPLIAGVNDSPELIRRTARRFQPYREQIPKVYLLPYHTLGFSKLEALGRSTSACASFRPPEAEHLERLVRIWQEHGFSAQIG